MPPTLQMEERDEEEGHREDGEEDAYDAALKVTPGRIFIGKDEVPVQRGRYEGAGKRVGRRAGKRAGGRAGRRARMMATYPGETFMPKMPLRTPPNAKPALEAETVISQRSSEFLIEVSRLSRRALESDAGGD